MMLFVPLLAAALAAAPTTTSPSRSGKLHHLHFTVRDVAHGEYDQPFTRFLVGARIPVTVPSTLGSGHGPFTTVYTGALTVRAAASGLEVGPPRGEVIDVTCARPGTFELAVTAGGIADAIDIHCVAPTRITATAPSGERYLAGASMLPTRVTWFGSAGELVGFLPVAVAPGETAIALDSQANDLDDMPLFRALRGATRPQISAGGLRTELPVTIVESPRWTLELRVFRRGRHLAAAARALDERGQPFAAVKTCTFTSELAGVTTPLRTDWCDVGGLDPSRQDRICATLLGRTECRPVR